MKFANAGAYAQNRKIQILRDLVGRHEPRPERAAVMKVLARRDLTFVPPVVAQRMVPETRVARDVVEGILFRDVTPVLADDHRELGFEIEF